MSDVEMLDLTTEMEWSDGMETEAEDKPWVFVDIQGFKVNKNRFMCKEFCLIDGGERFHSIVKSWFSWNKLLYHYKRQAQWLNNFFHGLNYECGDMDINELTQTVYPKLVGKIVMVKGFDKIKWMKDIFRKCGDIDCRNIEDLKLDPVDQYDGKYALCDYHKNRFGPVKYRCAMQSALKLQDISNKNAPIRFFH